MRGVFDKGRRAGMNHERVLLLFGYIGFTFVSREKRGVEMFSLPCTTAAASTFSCRVRGFDNFIGT